MNKLTTLALVAVVQAALVTTAVAPQLMARFTGETYQFKVAPLDPIDPFRGAYVTLDYPDLQRPDQDNYEDRGPIYLTLVAEGDVMVAEQFLDDRPDGDTPYLACHDDGWQVDCGIDSLFLPQDEAADMEDTLRDGAIAEVRIDGRGNAALIDVRAP